MSIHLDVESDVSKVMFGSLIIDFLFMLLLYYLCLWFFIDTLFIILYIIINLYFYKFINKNFDLSYNSIILVFLSK
jgi:hypothetical protein